MRPLLFLAILAAVLYTRTSRAEENRTARAATDGAAVVREINLARQHPKTYAEFLEELRTHYHGKVLVLPGQAKLHTSEGVAAVDEAIRFLRHAHPTGLLIISPGMARAAAEHVSDQASGALGHTGSDRSSPADRISRHGTWSGRWGENIAYGRSRARNIVLALLIDDGLRSRHHRDIIFNPAFHYAGAALGAHARYRTSCSIDFAAGYVEAGASSRSLLAGN